MIQQLLHANQQNGVHSHRWRATPEERGKAGCTPTRSLPRRGKTVEWRAERSTPPTPIRLLAETTPRPAVTIEPGAATPGRHPDQPAASIGRSGSWWKAHTFPVSDRVTVPRCCDQLSGKCARSARQAVGRLEEINSPWQAPISRGAGQISSPEPGARAEVCFVPQITARGGPSPALDLRTLM